MKKKKITISIALLTVILIPSISLDFIGDSDGYITLGSDWEDNYPYMGTHYNLLERSINLIEYVWDTKYRRSNDNILKDIYEEFTSSSSYYIRHMVDEQDDYDSGTQYLQHSWNPYDSYGGYALSYSEDFYDQAIDYFEDEHYYASYMSLARGIHLIQDCTVPHHAWNIPDGKHGDYEEFIYYQLNTPGYGGRKISPNPTKIDCSPKYSLWCSPVESFVQTAAKEAHPYYSFIECTDDGSTTWINIATKLTSIAVELTAGFLVRFWIETHPSTDDTDLDGITDIDEILITHTNPIYEDSDVDGFSDKQEWEYWNTHMDYGAFDDPDEDMIPNILDPDSDNDFANDGLEMHPYGYNTDPAVISSLDGDNLHDDLEINGIYPTNHELSDTDNDGLDDYEELLYWNGWSEPFNYIPYHKKVELVENTGIYVLDVCDYIPYDFDAIDDRRKFSPYSWDEDIEDNDRDRVLSTGDGDGILNIIDPDSDNDGLLDGFELGYEYVIEPWIADTDFDFLNDEFEYFTQIHPENYGGYSFDPSNAYTFGHAPTKDGSEDFDTDGLSVYNEYYTHGTDFWNDDTDYDGIKDKEEVFSGSDGFITNPLFYDTDHDSLSDYDEITGTFGYQTDPTSMDTDGDGVYDNEEIAGGYNPLDPNDPGEPIPNSVRNFIGVSNYINKITLTWDPPTNDMSGWYFKIWRKTATTAYILITTTTSTYFYDYPTRYTTLYYKITCYNNQDNNGAYSYWSGYVISGGSSGGGGPM